MVYSHYAAPPPRAVTGIQFIPRAVMREIAEYGTITGPIRRQPQGDPADVPFLTPLRDSLAARTDDDQVDTILHELTGRIPGRPAVQKIGDLTSTDH